MSDFLDHYPEVEGIEAVEGRIDYHWNGEADFNPESNRRFLQQYPGGKPGDAEWKLFRARGLTELHALLASVAHRRHKTSWAVQTWAVGPDGELRASETLRDASGFDFDGILDLPRPERIDTIAVELIWQEWKNTFGSALFSPDWTARAARELVKPVGRRARPVVHVELTPFGGVTPTLEEFSRALSAALSESFGASFYDYHFGGRKSRLSDDKKGLRSRRTILTRKKMKTAVSFFFQ